MGATGKIRYERALIPVDANVGVLILSSGQRPESAIDLREHSRWSELQGDSARGAQVFKRERSPPLSFVEQAKPRMVSMRAIWKPLESK